MASSENPKIKACDRTESDVGADMIVCPWSLYILSNKEERIKNRAESPAHNSPGQRRAVK